MNSNDPLANNNNAKNNDDDAMRDIDDANQQQLMTTSAEPQNDVLMMDEEIDETVEKAKRNAVVTHLRYPVPVKSNLKTIYEDNYGLVRGVASAHIQHRNEEGSADAKSNGATPPSEIITDNAHQAKLVNVWLPFIDLLLPNRHEVFSIVQQSLLKHLESIISSGSLAAVTGKMGGTSSDAHSGAPATTAGSLLSSAASSSTLTPAKLIPTPTSASSNGGSSFATPNTISNQQLRQLFDYLLPYFHNPVMKPIWRIVLLEMKRRDMTLESIVVARLCIERNLWTQPSEEASATTAPEDERASQLKRRSTTTATTSEDSDHTIRQQDLLIKTYLWRIHPQHFLNFLHTDHNLYNIHILAQHVDHIVLYNYLLSEWRKAYKKNPKRRQQIAVLRRSFSCALHTSPSPSARSLHDMIEKKDPLSPLVKLLENWINHHDLMITEFRNANFTRLKNILRQLSQFFDSIQKREKIWKDVSIMFSEKHLQRIIVHDIFAYIFLLYNTNLDKNLQSSGRSGASTKRKKAQLDPKTTTNMLTVNLVEEQTLSHLLHNSPQFSNFQPAAAKDHHDQALLVLTQAFLLGEHALLMLKKRTQRTLPVVFQSVLADAYPYILKLLHASVAGVENTAASATSDAMRDVSEETEASIHLRSKKKVNVLYTDPLLRKIMLRVCIHTLSKKHSDKFHTLMKYMFEEDLNLQEVTMDEEFHVFIKPMMEKCVRRWRGETKQGTAVDFSRPAEHTTDETLRLYFITPLLLPFLRRIVCPLGEHTPSEYTNDLVGIEHTSHSDEKWFVREFYALTEAVNATRRDQRSSAAQEIVRDIATNLSGLLSGSLERLFSVLKWDSDERGQALLNDLKENVRKLQ